MVAIKIVAVSSDIVYLRSKFNIFFARCDQVMIVTAITA